MVRLQSYSNPNLLRALCLKQLLVPSLMLTNGFGGRFVFHFKNMTTTWPSALQRDAGSLGQGENGENKKVISC